MLFQCFLGRISTLTLHTPEVEHEKKMHHAQLDLHTVWILHLFAFVHILFCVTLYFLLSTNPMNQKIKTSLSLNIFKLLYPICGPFILIEDLNLYK